MEAQKLTTSSKRIEIIDILRGFALVGILYAHMVFWYTGAALPPQVYFQFDSLLDNVSFAIFGAFVFGKFFSIFSFLFGLSFYLQFKKSALNSAFLGTYLWRLLLLLLIGILHHIFWRGDILAIYAVLGGLLILFRRMPLKLILMLSIILITNLPTHLYELFQPQTSEINFPMAAEAEKYYSLVKNGDLITNFKENWNSWPGKIAYQLESGRLLMTFGYFMLGLWAGRSKLFSKMEQKIFRFRRWNRGSKNAVLGLLFLGLLMYIFDLVSLPQLEIAEAFRWPAAFLFSIYNACLTIFFITSIVLIYNNRAFRSYLVPLAQMGKMALTNYLLQTVFGLLLFYDFGFSLFEKTSPAINIILTLGVFYLQLKFSELWLRHHQQGPVEWLWKGLTYFKFFRNKKQRPNTATS